MAGRYFFAWRMFAAAKAQDDRNYNTSVEASARASFNAFNDLTGRQFRERYRYSKKLFKFLCLELRRLTNLRSSQRVSLEHKVLTALFFFATGTYQRPVGVAKHISQKMCSVYIEQLTSGEEKKQIVCQICTRVWAKYSIGNSKSCVCYNDMWLWVDRCAW
ncbi:jg26288 [Pararge aegeria aegeria]|uniref:Jg26288 protein n=1 Tax=Pararge aegeria aegeria TaxID=348720 RepID=A0A8S4QCV2_9NEOP|nr:jg26288 [Pararge aegeria aegeria]